MRDAERQVKEKLQSKRLELQQKNLAEENEFIDWLMNTLCPDLLDSGHEGTVDDFVTLVDIAQRREEEIVNLTHTIDTFRAQSVKDKAQFDRVSVLMGGLVKNALDDVDRLTKQVSALEQELLMERE